ncbi:hypothetical protein NVP2275O_316 [Vibrio phage 2.275.O._10N.286.54.E11]|nr:hypothetical protein NVP2275O_316 [Vibrio phage 2.275.O._10N.286.54.E11]
MTTELFGSNPGLAGKTALKLIIGIKHYVMCH